MRKMKCEGSPECGDSACPHYEEHKEEGSCPSECNRSGSIRKGSLCREFKEVKGAKPMKTKLKIGDMWNDNRVTFEITDIRQPAEGEGNPDNNADNWVFRKDVDGDRKDKCREWWVLEHCTKVSEVTELGHIDDHNSIGISALIERHACDEGLLWFAKRFRGSNATMRCIYKDIPMDKHDWRSWLEKKFPEYFKVQYCCDGMKDHVNGGWVRKTSYGAVGPKGSEGGAIMFRFTYCPFCGKMIEEAQ